MSTVHEFVEIDVMWVISGLLQREFHQVVAMLNGCILLLSVDLHYDLFGFVAEFD